MKLYINKLNNQLFAMSPSSQPIGDNDTTIEVDYDCSYEDHEFYKYIYDPETNTISIDENATPPEIGDIPIPPVEQ